MGWIVSWARIAAKAFCMVCACIGKVNIQMLCVFVYSPSNHPMTLVMLSPHSTPYARAMRLAIQQSHLTGYLILHLLHIIYILPCMPSNRREKSCFYMKLHQKASEAIIHSCYSIHSNRVLRPGFVSLPGWTIYDPPHSSIHLDRWDFNSSRVGRCSQVQLYPVPT